MDTEHGPMSHEDKMKWKREWREHMAMRALTAVVVIIFVFWCGFQFGEIRTLAGEHAGVYGQMQMRGSGWSGSSMGGQ